MKKIRLIGVLISLVMLFNLYGCSLFSADTNKLLSPPELTGEMAPIAEALNKTAPEGYTLKYPSGGHYRSALVQNDIDNDGVFEAFALYSTVDGDITYIHINLIINTSGEWQSVDEQKVVAGGVERIDFADINSDGTLEVLLGLEVYGTAEKQLAVYSLSGQVLTQRMLERYTHFLCDDLNADNENELFLINFNPAESINYAALYNLTDSGVEEISRCSLDSSVEAVNEPVISTLSNGTTAVYIDEIKGAGAITEVVYVEKNNLVNPLLGSKGQNVVTLRSSMIESKDINGDGIIEIPIQTVLPSVFYKNQETLYYTDWYSFNGSVLTKKISTIMNFNDGYYLVVPSIFEGKLSVLKDTERRLRIIYRYDPETETIGAEMVRVLALSEKTWDAEDYDREGLIELARDKGTVFIAKVSGYDNEQEELERLLKSSFKLMEQEAIE